MNVIIETDDHGTEHRDVPLDSIVSGKIENILDVLDTILGDTDPEIPEDYTDEEIKKEFPIFWIHKELFSLIANQ